MRTLYALLLAGFALTALPASAQVTAVADGNWSDPATWSSGVPTATTDVTITDFAVTIDVTDAVARNVTIAGTGILRPGRAPDLVGRGITVFGNLVIQGNAASFLPLSNQDDNGVGYGAVYHRLTVHGNVDNSTGGAFDMRRGATSSTPATAAFIDLIFAGDQNATFTLGTYDTNLNQLFRVEVAKANGARVALGNDAAQDNNSLATLTFTSGYIQTNQFRWTSISANSAVVGAGSPASYLIGELARGFSTGTPSSQYNRVYPIGDAAGYRPVTIYATQRPSSNQQLSARVVAGDADTGSSTLQSLADVSPVRYYAFSIYALTGADPITIDRVEPTYGTDDGVASGSTQFVVAGSTDNRATWTNRGGFEPDGTTPHTTSLASPPTPISSGALPGWTFTFQIVGGQVVGTTNYAAIGTTGMFVAGSDAPSASAFGLSSAPNPARNATTVAFSLDAASDVTVAVYDVLGRRVATLADAAFPVGDHSVTWDAGTLSAGVYVLRLQAGAQSATRTLTVTR